MHGCQSESCGSGSCSTGDKQPEASTSTGSWGAAQATKPSQQRPNCLKCRTEPAVVAVRQKEPLCKGCLEANILSKVRAAIKVQGVVQPGDRILVPVSGGPASLALVHLLLNLQNANMERLERGKVVFDLVLVHVDESQVWSIAEEQRHQLLIDLQAAVKAAGFCGAVAITPLQAVVNACAEQQLQKLQACLAAVPDVTGREDLVSCLRRKMVQVHAQREGCNKVAWGDCASRTAMQIIADFSKGRGYSLPASIQLLDARNGPDAPVSVYLLRDISNKELALLCRHRGIPCRSMAVLPAHARSSINQLAEAFIETLQAQVPHTIYTVVKTAAHLQPFPFNDLPASARGMARARGEATTGNTARPVADRSNAAVPCTPSPASSGPVQALCRVCDAPLSERDIRGAVGSGAQVAQMACSSCRFQLAGGHSNGSAAAVGGTIDLLSGLTVS